MTPINYLSPDAEGSDGEFLDVSSDLSTVWLPAAVEDSRVGEWTAAEVARYTDDIFESGHPTPEARDAERVRRVFEAVAAGRRSVDLDVDDWAAAELADVMGEARGLRRYGHPSLSAAERG